MKQVTIHLGHRTYPVLIESNLLENCNEKIHHFTQARKVLILSHSLVYKKYGRSIQSGLKKLGVKVHVYLIPRGESHKNREELFKILEKMVEFNLQKDSCLLTLGGGVIGDIGGLAASIYMRGIDLIHCPTTLLAQVDSSVGGKTAIDLFKIKNLVGTFYQPKCVLTDPEVLKTLDQRQLKTGLAEIIKYAVIWDKKMFGYIEKKIGLILERNANILLKLIYRSCAIKGIIVSGDEREKGKRAWLNYGHTLGHALESYFNYKVLTHGEAIAWGMWFASLISLRMGLCSAATVDRQQSLLKQTGLLRRLPTLNLQKIYKKMFLDKKVRGGQILFVLTRKIGLVTIQKNVPKSVVFWALNQLRNQSSGTF